MVSYFDIISSLISIIALIISILGIYFTYFRKGHLRFPRPTSFGGTKYPNGTDDIIIVPITAINDGAKPKTVRLGLIANSQKQFNQQADFDMVQIPWSSSAPFNPEGHMFTATPMVIAPLSASVKTVGFTQHNYIPSMPLNPPHFDLWFKEEHKEDSEWEFAYRIRWTGFEMDAYKKGNFIMSTKKFELSRKKPTYDAKKMLEG